MTEKRAANGASGRDGAEAGAPAASWRTMMATFVTRLERDHEALLEALRGRLDEAESRSRALEARLEALERAQGRPLAAADGDRLEARLQALEEGLRQAPAGAPAPARVRRAAARGSTGARARGGARPQARSEASPPAGAPAPAGGAPAPAPAAPGQDAAQAMLRRESEVLTRADRGEAPRDIAAALGRALGEVELVLRLAERAGRGRVGAAADGRGGI